MFARCLQSRKFEVFKLYIMATLKFRLLSTKDHAPIYCYFSLGRKQFYQRKIVASFFRRKKPENMRYPHHACRRGAGEALVPFSLKAARKQKKTEYREDCCSRHQRGGLPPTATRRDFGFLFWRIFAGRWEEILPGCLLLYRLGEKG